MSILSEEIRNRIKQIDQLIAVLENQNLYSPDGHLRVSNTGGRSRYYHVIDDKNCQGNYLDKSQIDLTRALAQKEYRHLVLKSLYREHTLLQRLYRFYYGKETSEQTDKTPEKHFYHGPEEHILQNMNIGKSSLITPVILDDQLFLKEWLSQEYEKKDLPKQVCTELPYKSNMQCQSNFRSFKCLLLPMILFLYFSPECCT